MSIENIQYKKTKDVPKMTKSNIVVKVNLALPYLVYYAQVKKTLTYKELGEKINYYYRAVPHVLRYIRDEICIKRELPMINVIVVNGKTQKPGENFLPEGTLHLSSKEYDKRFNEYKNEVFSCTKWDELLKELNLTPIKDR